MTVFAASSCKLGFNFFCEMGHFAWAVYTFFAFLVTIPLCFIERINRFIIINTISVVTLFLTIGVLIFNLTPTIWNKDLRLEPEAPRKMIGTKIKSFEIFFN